MKKFFLIVLLISFQYSFSQKHFLDYIVTHDNDTIYGRYSTQHSFYDTTKKKHRISPKKVKTIRRNDKIYNLTLVNKKSYFSKNNDSLVSIDKSIKIAFNTKENKLFVRKVDKKRRDDYIITKLNDTVYGKIKVDLKRKYKLITNTNKKYNILPDKIKSFRRRGIDYYPKEKQRAVFSDKKNAYLGLIYNGKKLKLYEYDISPSNYYKTFMENNTPLINFTSNRHTTEFDYIYYFERNNKLYLINPKRLSAIIKKVFPENQEIIKKLKLREYTFRNIYLIAKYIDENLEK